MENGDIKKIDDRLRSIEARVELLLSLVRQAVSVPEDVQIRELARQVGAGNRQALREWNKRRKEELHGSD